MALKGISSKSVMAAIQDGPCRYSVLDGAMTGDLFHWEVR